MKITSNTADQLTLEYRPWIFGGVLIVGILGLSWVAMAKAQEGNLSEVLGFFVAIGLLSLCFWAFVRRAFVIFDHAADSVTIREASLTSATEVSQPLSRIDRAFVEESQSIQERGKKKPPTRPTLRLKPGPDPQDLPLISHFSSGKGTQQIVDAVNAWLTRKA